ncbi:MAG TPA: tetratricopeptide repeat protein [Bryobacteraceae bacterium]|nr:tetratricopeptide repeat protein [Bryobacteraceae bacterium]
MGFFLKQPVSLAALSLRLSNVYEGLCEAAVQAAEGINRAGDAVYQTVRDSLPTLVAFAMQFAIVNTLKPVEARPVLANVFFPVPQPSLKIYEKRFEVLDPKQFRLARATTEYMLAGLAFQEDCGTTGNQMIDDGLRQFGAEMFSKAFLITKKELTSVRLTQYDLQHRQETSTGARGVPSSGPKNSTTPEGLGKVPSLSSLRMPTAEALRHYNEGVALINSGRRVAALEEFDRAVAQSPDFEEAWFNKGSVLHAVGRYEEAIFCYDHAPGTFRAWCNKGQALRALGRHEAALASYEDALRINRNDKITWLNRGVALMKLKRDQEALVSYDRALALDQHYADAWVNKAGLLGQLKRYDEALECFDRGLRLNPSDSLGWLSKGNVLSEQQRWSEAVLCYEQAQRLGQATAASMIFTCRQKMDDNESL